MRNLIAAAFFVTISLAALFAQTGSPRYSSRIMIYDVNARSATLVYRADGIWEAPNWSRDGRFLLSNSNGKLYRIPVSGAPAPEAVNLDPSLRCNNDHDFSPDGRLLAISASSPTSRQSQVYVADADGANLRLVVSAGPSYFHGWSRDGKWIYFNSNRGGGWNIWRIPADGAGPDDRKAQRITDDDLEDWFPHPSPDGKSLLFLSFPHGTEGHNERGLQVQLRLISMPGDAVQEVQPRVIVALTGGQGSINVNSWA